MISLTASLVGLTAISIAMTPGWIAGWVSALRHYAQYARGPLVVLYFGGEIGAALSVVLLLGLAAALWRHRQSDLLFQVALSVSVFQLITPYEPYNVVMLLIPAVWIVDNAREIAGSGALNQIALAAVQVALILSWVVNAVGALLWHTSPKGRSIAWTLPGVMILPLLGCVVAMMLVQLFFPGRRLAANLATSRSVGLS